MAKLKLTREDLMGIGYKNGPIFGLICSEVPRQYKHAEKEEVLNILKEVLNDVDGYIERDDLLGQIARKLKPPVKKKIKGIELNEVAVPTKIYGRANIEKNALDQMETASKLPIAKQAALMPDAHGGYGLSIGGVLATDNAVIPYGVGVDIGCRMALTLYDLPTTVLDSEKDRLKKSLIENTAFGQGAEPDKVLDDEILTRTEIDEVPILKRNKSIIRSQLGSSGGGNHFVEYGIVTLLENNELGLEAKDYIALLSHSGSRGIGSKIAHYYTKLAKEKCKLPSPAKDLAWLDLDTEEGIEYWLAMNFAGDYAKACHDQIHTKISKSLGWKEVLKVENHHNFAWKETLENGDEAIVHRKGATPAGEGVLGIIPGSMGTEGFIVRGKGNYLSLNSASHGAGRALSRSKAREEFTRSEMRKFLRKKGVTLIGGGLDETPQAYKDIHQVMKDQIELVDSIGIFYPKIVRMADD